MSFSKCITSYFGYNPDESWENKRNVLSDWFIHILFHFSLRNYSLKKINNPLWLRGEVSVLQWCILISQIRQPLASCYWLELLSILISAAWVHGDPRRVAYPTDSEGHFCGLKGTPYEWVCPIFVSSELCV